MGEIKKKKNQPSGPTKCTHCRWDEFAEHQIFYQVCHLRHYSLALVDVFSDLFFFPHR